MPHLATTVYGPDSLRSQAPLVLSHREVSAVRGIATEARVLLVRLWQHIRF